VQLPLRISRRTKPSAAALRLIDALAKGETAAVTAYGRGIDPLLHEIDSLVRAQVPTVSSGHLHRPDGERLWLWWLGEPQAVGYYPRQQPATW